MRNKSSPYHKILQEAIDWESQFIPFDKPEPEKTKECELCGEHIAHGRLCGRCKFMLINNPDSAYARKHPELLEAIISAYRSGLEPLPGDMVDVSSTAMAPLDKQAVDIRAGGLEYDTDPEKELKTYGPTGHWNESTEEDLGDVESITNNPKLKLCTRFAAALEEHVFIVNYDDGNPYGALEHYYPIGTVRRALNDLYKEGIHLTDILSAVRYTRRHKLYDTGFEPAQIFEGIGYKYLEMAIAAQIKKQEREEYALYEKASGDELASVEAFPEPIQAARLDMYGSENEPTGLERGPYFNESTEDDFGGVGEFDRPDKGMKLANYWSAEMKEIFNRIPKAQILKAMYSKVPKSTRGAGMSEVDDALAQAIGFDSYLDMVNKVNCTVVWQDFHNLALRLAQEARARHTPISGVIHANPPSYKARGIKEGREEEMGDVSNFEPAPLQKYEIYYRVYTPGFKIRKTIHVNARNALAALGIAGTYATITNVDIKGIKPTPEERAEFKQDVLKQYETYDEDTVKSYLTDMSVDMEFSLRVEGAKEGVIFETEISPFNEEVEDLEDVDSFESPDMYQTALDMLASEGISAEIRQGSSGDASYKYIYCDDVERPLAVREKVEGLRYGLYGWDQKPYFKPGKGWTFVVAFTLADPTDSERYLEGTEPTLGDLRKGNVAVEQPIPPPPAETIPTEQDTGDVSFAPTMSAWSPEEQAVIDRYQMYYPQMGDAAAIAQVSKEMQFPYAAAFKIITAYNNKFNEAVTPAQAAAAYDREDGTKTPGSLINVSIGTNAEPPTFDDEYAAALRELNESEEDEFGSVDDFQKPSDLIGCRVRVDIPPHAFSDLSAIEQRASGRSGYIEDVDEERQQGYGTWAFVLFEESNGYGLWLPIEWLHFRDPEPDGDLDSLEESVEEDDLGGIESFEAPVQEETKILRSNINKILKLYGMVPAFTNKRAAGYNIKYDFRTNPKLGRKMKQEVEQLLTGYGIDYSFFTSYGPTLYFPFDMKLPNLQEIAAQAAKAEEAFKSASSLAKKMIKQMRSTPDLSSLIRETQLVPVGGGLIIQYWSMHREEKEMKAIAKHMQKLFPNSTLKLNNGFYSAEVVYIPYSLDTTKLTEEIENEDDEFGDIAEFDDPISKFKEELQACCRSAFAELQRQYPVFEGASLTFDQKEFMPPSIRRLQQISPETYESIIADYMKENDDEVKGRIKTLVSIVPKAVGVDFNISARTGQNRTVAIVDIGSKATANYGRGDMHLLWMSIDVSIKTKQVLSDIKIHTWDRRVQAALPDLANRPSPLLHEAVESDLDDVSKFETPAEREYFIDYVLYGHGSNEFHHARFRASDDQNALEAVITAFTGDEEWKEDFAGYDEDTLTDILNGFSNSDMDIIDITDAKGMRIYRGNANEDMFDDTEDTLISEDWS